MNDLRRMQAFDVFQWREAESGGEIQASGGVSSGESKNVTSFIDARCLLYCPNSQFVITILSTEQVKPEPFLMVNSKYGVNSYLQFNSVLLASVRKVDNVSFQKSNWDDLQHIHIETRLRLHFLGVTAVLSHGLCSSVCVSAKLHRFIQLDE